MTTQTAWRGRDLIGDGLRRRIVARILTDLEFWQYCGQLDEAERRRWAGRILDQTLAFLLVCADHLDAAHLCPSPLIDIGWHTFILHTREYHEFCHRVAGRYLHHSPADVAHAAAGYGTGASAIAFAGGCAEAMAAMRARGIAVDEELWGGPAGSCSPPAAGPNFTRP